jgi:hypothetical protein
VSAIELAWPGLGSFDSAREPMFVADVDADPVRLRKLTIGPVAALRRRLAGRASFHASAVQLPQGAVLLVGESGQGKSTQAAALCRFADGALLADDVAFVEVEGTSAIVHPSESEHWLDADAAAMLGSGHGSEQKEPLPTTAVGRPTLLRAIVVLDTSPPSAAPYEELRGVAVASALARALIRFPGEPAHARDLDVMAVMAAQASVLRMAPRAPDRGPAWFARTLGAFLAGAGVDRA